MDEFAIHLNDDEIKRQASMNDSLGGDDLWAAEQAAVAQKIRRTLIGPNVVSDEARHACKECGKEK